MAQKTVYICDLTGKEFRDESEMLEVKVEIQTRVGREYKLWRRWEIHSSALSKFGVDTDRLVEWFDARRTEREAQEKAEREKREGYVPTIDDAIAEMVQFAVEQAMAHRQ